MPEYIKREDALDKEITVAAYNDDGDRRWLGAVAFNDINAIPAADVVARTNNTVEVVRCDECKRGGYCGLRRVRRDIAFCSLGIRMDGDEHV